MSVKSELATIEAKSNKTLDVIEVLAKEIHGQMKAIIDAIDMAKNNSKASGMAKLNALIWHSMNFMDRQQQMICIAG